ncbi:phosphomannose isomerase type I [Olsenella sp. oral taxon 809 str. F0356]|uniref:type I phosphomannose isomerase catalytic subunit n=1 Tax=Olsenella sp. oral taxon 809 TaxID=661086 RepID=UPI000231ED48|nr:type I phosphomannose isomerase catalytic subunit [Olsenella sp. oral taxon 809]EHF01980.1 phosphomannose isomerase type I [Olsenella sp. oral taxon 809 str. F0356]
MRPLKLIPLYDRTIWAGERLSALRNRPAAGEGTSWEISVHPHAQSVVANGPDAGRTLRELIDSDPEGMEGPGMGDAELLRLAFLDARDPLSVQVHPDEAYAQAHARDHGKTEGWYVLDADPGAALVVGCDLTSKDEVARAIADDSIEDHLCRVPVTEDDFVFVPAGTLHALGAGILALEIGTNSNTTYRFYDYHRKDDEGNERELHVRRSLDVVRLDYRGNVVHTPLDGMPKERTLVSSPEFDVILIDVADTHVLPADHARFRTISCVRGACDLVCGGTSTHLGYTESAFLPAALGDVLVTGDCRLLVGIPHRR